jgi:hypothetical protein
VLKPDARWARQAGTKRLQQQQQQRQTQKLGRALSHRRPECTLNDTLGKFQQFTPTCIQILFSIVHFTHPHKKKKYYPYDHIHRAKRACKCNFTGYKYLNTCCHTSRENKNLTGICVGVHVISGASHFIPRES